MTNNTHAYGWRPDLPDQRDHLFMLAPTALPSEVDLRAQMPPVYDQGQLGSCTANAIAAHLDFNRAKQGEAFISPSRLFIYYNERVAEGTVDSDSGATIRESVKAITSFGAPHEKLWPYLISKFTRKPSKAAYTEGATTEAMTYQRLPRATSVFQACLAQGYPFVIGFTVYESFESASVAKDGIMSMPAPSEQVLGGHAVCVVGYKTINGKLYFIVRNSWGSAWGDKGYFYMPAEYLLSSKLSSDFWTLRKIK